MMERHEDSPAIQLRTPPLGHPGVAFGPDSISYNEDDIRAQTDLAIQDARLLRHDR